MLGGVQWKAVNEDCLALRRTWLEKLGERWHWFRWHFEQGHEPFVHAFIADMLIACSEIELHIEGFADEFIKRLVSLSGREKDQAHYEQLLQILAELVVIRQVVVYPWPEGTCHLYEPPSDASAKNPELIIATADYRIGIEVKCPSLQEHVKSRNTNSIQGVSRALPKDVLEKLAEGDAITLPRDNPVKDFLISAESKFAGHHEADPSFFGILVIVWDDFINEPISALVNPASGLLTPNSFYQPDGKPPTISYTDGIVIIRHLHQIARAAGDAPLIDGRVSFIDYGEPHQFPFKALIRVTEKGSQLPEEILECLQAYPQEHIMGAEYSATDMVMWVNTRRCDHDCPR